MKYQHIYYQDVLLLSGITALENQYIIVCYPCCGTSFIHYCVLYLLWNIFYALFCAIHAQSGVGTPGWRGEVTGLPTAALACQD